MRVSTVLFIPSLAATLALPYFPGCLDELVSREPRENESSEGAARPRRAGHHPTRRR
jgi:hypothetical protein